MYILINKSLAKVGVIRYVKMNYEDTCKLTSLSGEAKIYNKKQAKSIIKHFKGTLTLKAIKL